MKTCCRLLRLSALVALASHTLASEASVVTPAEQPYLMASKGPNAVYLTAGNTVAGTSYLIQTNTDATNPKSWGTWITVTATNTVTPLPPLALDFKEMFFRALVLSPSAPTATSGAQMLIYLGRLDTTARDKQITNSLAWTPGENQSEETLPGWGRIVNPDGDRNFYLGKEGVVIDVPGTPHDLAADINLTNTPCLLQPVRGDFTIQVCTDGRFETGTNTTKPGRIAYNGAAIIMASNPANVVTLARGVLQRDQGRPRYYANFEVRSGGELQRIGMTGITVCPRKAGFFSGFSARAPRSAVPSALMG